MSKTIALTLSSALLLVGGSALANHEEYACHKTSRHAEKACQHEAKDDYWIARGICNNLTSDDDREECQEEAKDDKKETKDECDEQFAAREDLCESLGQAPYDPNLDPDDFLTPEEAAADPNPYFPLIPGAEWIYEDEESGETITVTVTGDTKVILGIETTVVRDVVTVGSEKIEDTLDWYAQDELGNVWYIGEIAQNFEDGELVDVEGSWTAGVEGAKAGILMKAFPAVGDVYRQEWDLGNAEDAGEILSITGTAMTPGGSCVGDCVVTLDFTPIEPDHLEHKYYAPGIGLVLEVDPETGDRVELQSCNLAGCTP